MPVLKKASTLHELLLNKLQALYDVEGQIIKAMPRVLKKVTDEDLKNALQFHREETKGHVKRLERCFALLKEKPRKLAGEAIRGLVEDADWVTAHVEKGPALDASLLSAVRYIEHYEIAGYGSALEWAKLMGHAEVDELLGLTWTEKVKADEALADLAETKINALVDLGM